MRRALRDIRLLDKIEELAIEEFSGTVFRLVRDGRYPLDCWHPKGRWDDGEFDILYTSMTQEGAAAEIGYHLSQQPFIPDFMDYRMFKIAVSALPIINMLDQKLLEKLGVDMNIWGKSDYISRGEEYVRTQEIGAVAAFHERAGLIVPSARSHDSNLLIITQDNADKYCSEPEDLGLYQF